MDSGIFAPRGTAGLRGAVKNYGALIFSTGACALAAANLFWSYSMLASSSKLAQLDEISAQQLAKVRAQEAEVDRLKTELAILKIKVDFYTRKYQ